MLWYKAWLDTWARFLVSLVGITGLVSYVVFHNERTALSYAERSYYDSAFHGIHNLLCVLWVMAVTLLMMGGLLRERAAGLSSFTLALPVSRTHLMRVRILMGLGQAVALVVVPWSAMLLVGTMTGKTPSLAQAGFHVLLLVGGGLVFFGVALLVSSLVEGEYTAPIISFGTMIGLAIATADRALRAYNPWTFIVGGEYWNRDSALLVGPLPWLNIVGWMAIAMALIVISVTAIEKREF